MFKQDIFDKIFVKKESGEKYYVIDNGYKIWIIPDENMESGYGIYQISSFKGKLVRYVLPKLKEIKFIRRLAKSRVEYLGIKDEVKSVIDKYCDKNYKCSVYYGNLDAEQNYKATIQVYEKERTLLYIKITNNPIVKKTIEKEFVNIKKLEELGVRGLPKVIAVENIGEWCYFIQKPQKSDGKNTFIIEKSHWDFLEELYIKTRGVAQYDDSEISYYLDYLQYQFEHNDTIKEYKVIGEALDIVKEWLNEEGREYSFSHGDFTPWNVYCDKGILYPFDFEYSMTKTIPFIDYFHFICQTDIIVNNMNVNMTLKKYEKDKKILDKYIREPEKAFVGYLLYIISFYVIRKKGKVVTENKQFQYRIKLLENLLYKR